METELARCGTRSLRDKTVNEARMKAVAEQSETPRLRMPFAETLGIRYLSAEPDRVTAEMDVREEL